MPRLYLCVVLHAGEQRGDHAEHAAVEGPEKGECHPVIFSFLIKACSAKGLETG